MNDQLYFRMWDKSRRSQDAIQFERELKQAKEEREIQDILDYQAQKQAELKAKHGGLLNTKQFLDKQKHYESKRKNMMNKTLQVHE